VETGLPRRSESLRTPFRWGGRFCHNEGNTGGAGVQIETRAGRITNGVFNPLTNEGGSLFRHFGIGAQVPNRACTTTGEVIPADANVTAGRVTRPWGSRLEDVNDRPPQGSAAMLANCDSNAGISTPDPSGTGTDQSGNVMAAISKVQYHPFRDFLLHDMGSLNDNVDQGNGSA
jgi:hypothetical protein